MAYMGYLNLIKILLLKISKFNAHYHTVLEQLPQSWYHQVVIIFSVFNTSTV